MASSTAANPNLEQTVLVETPEQSKALDVIRVKSRELDEILDDPHTALVQILLTVQEIRTATGILRAAILDKFED